MHGDALLYQVAMSSSLELLVGYYNFQKIEIPALKNVTAAVKARERERSIAVWFQDQVPVSI